LSTPRLLPEQEARVLIDELLEAAGWVVQDYQDADIAAAEGVAVREFPTARGPVDYLLFASAKAVGSVEAKPVGRTLRSVESQAERYADGFEESVKGKAYPRYADRLPFHYISTGVETLFTSRRDPIRRPREVFHLHRPETLATWAQEEHPLRARLRQLPPLNTEGMRSIQQKAIRNLELSLRDDRPKALVAITMGGGKTYVAAAESYRLLRFGGAKRILFLVDRISLGDQARDELLGYVSPDDRRRFGDDFVIQVLRSNRIEPSANVVISTIQRLYSVLRGEEDYDPDLDERSSFELGDGGRPVEVSYQSAVPIEMFDLVWTDECHRSIYGRWGQVLDYFDSFVVGLTATPTPTTTAYFDDNVVAEYSQEESVLDGINVDQQLYRIRTEVSERGGEIGAGEWVRVRDKQTRAVELRQLDDEFVYEREKLDRAVMNPSQIRLVVRTFKERVCSEIFAGREEVPKTVFFCKSDQHAEDVLKIVWEEFGRGSDFARKITYKSEGSVQDHIKQFRNDPQFRIAVSVDQIGTGTNVRAVECLVFLRMVGSRVLFNQMRGRAVRTIDRTDFWQVTPGAQEKGQTKDYCVLVDCVGLTDEEVVLKDTNPLDTKPTVPFRALLRDIALGITDDETLRSAAVRLVRLDRRLAADEREEFAGTAGGATMTEIASELRKAADPDHQLATAQERTGQEEPAAAELDSARDELVTHAIAQLRRAEVRQKLEELQAEAAEQLIHVGGHDTLIDAGYVDDDRATELVQSWREFIEKHHDDYEALRAYYSEPYRRRPSWRDIKELARAIEKPPMNLTPQRLWTAYEQLEGSRVKGSGGRVLTDLVQLVRYALERDEELHPREEVVRLRFDLWLSEQQQGGRAFSREQIGWLEMLRDHIASSMGFDPAEDYDVTPFAEEGGMEAAYGLFGKDLASVVEELSEVLAEA
jgi:type I restriction enzyme R subunit